MIYIYIYIYVCIYFYLCVYVRLIVYVFSLRLCQLRSPGLLGIPSSHPLWKMDKTVPPVSTSPGCPRHAGVPRTSLRKIFKEIDVQGDGKLNYEHFLEGVSHGSFHCHGVLQ